LRRARRTLARRIARGLFWLTLAGVVASELVVLLLRFVPPPTTAFMLAARLDAWRDGDRDFRLRYRWTPYARLAPELPIALVAAEDQKFPIHHGFDVEAIREAIEDADEGEPLRGASTISQQTAKNLFLWSGHSFVRKGLEVWFTVLIELNWPKRRILEVYVNVAEFGPGIYGAAAASAAFFGKTPDTLTASEAARLAAVLPNPRRHRVDAPSPYVLRRQLWIERQVRQLGGPDYLRR